MLLKKKLNKSNDISDLQETLNNLIKNLNISNNRTYLIEYKDTSSDNINTKEKLDNKILKHQKKEKLKEKVKYVGGNVKKEYKHLNVIKANLSDDMLKKLKKDPEIARIEQDYYFAIQSENIPWGIETIGATEAHKSGVNGENIKIAVFDTGISEHSDLNISGAFL